MNILKIFTERLLPAAGLWVLLTGTAYAENCNNLDRNTNFQKQYEKLVAAVQASDYPTALTYGNTLLEICSKAPKLNYIVAKIYQQMGDQPRALFYFQTATRNTKDFEVESDILEMMWTDLLYAEHPEISPQSMANLKNDMDALDARVALLENQIEEKDQKIADQIEVIHELQDSTRETYKTLMWTGAGIGIAGLGLTVAGAAMVATMDSPLNYEKPSSPDNKEHRATIENKYPAAWGLLSAGIAVTVAGSIITGIAGYQYTHYQSVNNSATDDGMALSISPMGFSISGTF